MTSDIAIRIEGLSKQYKIGTRKYRHDTLREQIVHGLKSMFSRNGVSSEPTTIWALRDVSCEVRAGETVGIIGRNGSGKSTLLKILSRITEPTLGRALLRGRVGSLLEVGTGFDGDLTGRENTYLNGAILGMRKAEIDKKFDEIVAFSEVEKFIDTPVKRYSSGMYVRLAFAVAAHLETEILFVDEVLAVGDLQFQTKCLKKMEDIGGKGRTILFVSHGMSAISRLCNRAILLNDGRLVQDGSATSVVGAYLQSGPATPSAVEWPDPDRAPTGQFARLRAVRIRTADGPVGETVDIHETISIEMEYDVLVEGKLLLAAFNLEKGNQVLVCEMIDLDPEWRGKPRPIGRYTSTAWIPGNFLSEGLHYIDVGLALLNSGEMEFHKRQVVSFKVIEGVNVGAARGDYRFEMNGVVRPVFKWTTRYSPLENQR